MKYGFYNLLGDQRHLYLSYDHQYFKEFENKKIVIEHYETLAHIFNMEIKISQKISNPVRELGSMENVLQIAPFEKKLHTGSIWKLISTKVEDFLLTTKKHPKLLVPFALTDEQ